MIYAIMTIYNPDLNVIENIKSISMQVDKIYLCDNSLNSNDFVFQMTNNHIEYYFFNENKGLSVAFNYILKNKTFKNDDFIIFFDQDSHISKDHIKNLINEYNIIRDRNFSIGCIGPIYYNTSSNKIEIPKQKKHVTQHTFEVKSLITSSMLCTFSSLKQVGFWNEKIFLDMADWDLCWRMISNKLKCYMTDSVVLYHSLGKSEKRILFFSLRVGNAFRVYYQTRDCLYLLKEKYVPFKYKIRFILTVSLRPFLHLLFLEDKIERLLYVNKGLLDYIYGRHGVLKLYKKENNNN